MEFKEIMDMDYSVFQLDWREYDPEERMLRLLLIDRYLRLFGRQHGLDLYVFEEFRYIPTAKFGRFSLEDAFAETCELEEHNMFLFCDVAEYSGFEVEYIWADPECFECNGIEGEEAACMEKIYEHLGGRMSEDWKSILQENAAILENTYCSGENGAFVIMRSKILGAYYALCDRYDEMLRDHLWEEKMAIDKVMNIVREPLNWYWDYNQGILDGYYYVCFNLYNDGFTYVDMLSLDYNWLLACIVLKHLLDDFKIKLKGIFRQGLPLEVA